MKFKQPKNLKKRTVRKNLMRPVHAIVAKNMNDYDNSQRAIGRILKNHEQSSMADEKYLKKSELYRLMTEEPNRVWWKDELRFHFDVGERVIRAMLSELGMHAPLLALSTTKGYRVIKILDQADERSLKADLEAVDHQLSEFQSRIANLRARMKPLMACRAEINSRLCK